MPLKVSLNDFKEMTEASERFLHQVKPVGGRFKVVVATSQYVAEDVVDDVKLEEIKKWLSERHSIEVIGYLDWQQAFR